MDFKPIKEEVMYTEAEAYFNLKVDLPKNNKYYTDCEIVEMLDDYHKERLNSVTEDDIDARGMVYLQCDKQAPLLRAFKLGYYECVNLLKKK